MTIENETGQEVHPSAAMPTEVTVVGEEQVIRTNMNKVADWLVQFSSFSQKLNEMEDQMKGLTSALENAEKRVADASAERDHAKFEQGKAEGDARMAREAYRTVATDRDEVVARLSVVTEERDCSYIEADALHNELLSKTAIISDFQRELQETAAQRDSFRAERDSAKIDLEASREHYSEASREWDSEKTQLRQELAGLHHKLNGLETEHARVINNLAAHKTKLDNMRQLLDLGDVLKAAE